MHSLEFNSANAALSEENQLEAEGELPKLEFPEIDGLEDMTLRSLILEYRQQGVSGQNAFIKAFWDISAGESRRYLRARERYQLVCQRFGL